MLCTKVFVLLSISAICIQGALCENRCYNSLCSTGMIVRVQQLTVAIGRLFLSWSTR